MSHAAPDEKVKPRERRAELRFVPTRGCGPVGTGVHLLRVREISSTMVEGEAWLTLLFLPLLPLGKWAMERPNEGQRGLRITGVSRPGLTTSVSWIIGGVAYLAASVLPGGCAVTCFIGSQKAALAGLFSSAGAIVGGLGWLDQTRDRVPLGVALQAIRSLSER